MSKSNIVASIEDTLRRIDDQLATKPKQSAWMIPLKADLTLLLAEARQAPYSSEPALQQKLKDVLSKHQPKDEEGECKHDYEG